MSNTDTRLLTVRDCCERASVSRATFYRLAKSDPSFPPLLKIGSGTRIRSDAWAAYVDSLSSPSEAA